MEELKTRLKEITDDVQGLLNRGYNIDDLLPIVASGPTSHAEGFETKALGDSSHAEGNSSEAHEYVSHAEGLETIAHGQVSHTEGQQTEAYGLCDHAEGRASKTNATPIYDYKPTQDSGSSGSGSGTSGGSTTGTPTYDTLIKDGSHVEGMYNQAIGWGAHVEGSQNFGVGVGVHAEGASNSAGGVINPDGTVTFTGYVAHAEGEYNKALGTASHAQGSRTEAKGHSSFTGGIGTYVENDYATALGKWNLKDTTGNIAFAIGNGYDSLNRQNAMELSWDGNVKFMGTIRGRNGFAVAYQQDMDLKQNITDNSLQTTSKTIVGAINELARPRVLTTMGATAEINALYDLGVQTTLSINLPNGQLGDWIEIDFLSGTTATNLTITSAYGMSDFDIVPEVNTGYSIYCSWAKLDSTTYGWVIKSYDFVKATI